MNCHELVKRIAKLHPDAEPRQIARACLLLCNQFDSLDPFRDSERLERAWQAMELRIQAATDQHAAMTSELESLARTDPAQFDKQQIWVLIRAIKVQSQILELYMGERVLDV